MSLNYEQWLEAQKKDEAEWYGTKEFEYYERRRAERLGYYAYLLGTEQMLEGFLELLVEEMPRLVELGLGEDIAGYLYRVMNERG